MKLVASFWNTCVRILSFYLSCYLWVSLKWYTTRTVLAWNWEKLGYFFFPMMFSFVITDEIRQSVIFLQSIALSSLLNIHLWFINLSSSWSSFTMITVVLGMWILIRDFSCLKWFLFHSFQVFSKSWINFLEVWYSAFYWLDIFRYLQIGCKGGIYYEDVEKDCKAL